jgi:hypothetical protein
MAARAKRAATAPAGSRRRAKTVKREPDPAETGARERAVRHRLVPGSALRDLEDAGGFLEQMGLLTQTPHPYLPSLFGAAQGKPAKPGAGGFGQWPEHAWGWAGELAEREDVLLSKVILGKRTLIHQRLWPVVDAAVRDRQPQSKDAQALVKVLEKQPSVRTDELRELAGKGGPDGKKPYQRAMDELEGGGLLLCRPVVVDNHKHVALAELWNVRFPTPLSKTRGPQGLITAAIAAAGPVPYREALKWFPWSRAELERVIDEMVSKGLLRNLDGILRT